VTNFFRIDSECHINRDLVTRAVLGSPSDGSDSGFVVRYSLTDGSVESSRHATKDAALRELRTFLKGPAASEPAASEPADKTAASRFPGRNPARLDAD